MSVLRVATYNIHKCCGLDRRVLPARIADVLLELDADVIALQEVVRGKFRRRRRQHPPEDQIHGITELPNAARGRNQRPYSFCFGETRKLKTGAAYGNALITRLPLLAWESYLLPLIRRERRGCLRADLELAPPSGKSRILHLFNVHRGTGLRERRAQGPRLVSDEIARRTGLSGPRIIAGDFNEWTLGLTTRLLRREFRSADLERFTGRRRTYPGILPLLHLDHIYYDHHLRLVDFAVHRSRKALLASDHLPLVADFALA